jgi:CubicO group peptidase (beta-lactamase class C family)
VPQWQRPGDPRNAITLRHLLQMRSGLRHTEAGDPPYESSEIRMLFLDGRDDMARWAREQPLEAEPGKTFEYSSNTTVILADIAARALTTSTKPDARRKAVADYLQVRLFGPLGMTSMVPEFDASGTLIGGSLMHATARDWAKLGEMLRRKGRSPEGEQLVPQRWVEAMVTPSPRSPHYGFQTWLNRPIPGRAPEDHPLFPDRAPQSLFSLIGHMGQYVLVSPAQQVTLVRLGHSDTAQRPPMLQQAADVLELYPER